MINLIAQDEMKKNLLPILACPKCKSPLDLMIEEEKDDEILTGSLTCTNCGLVFRIVDAIPALILSD